MQTKSDRIKCFKRRNWISNADVVHVFRFRTQVFRYLSVNSPELIFDLVNAKPGNNHSTNPTNPNGNSKR